MSEKKATILSHLGDIKITHLHRAVLVHEDVGALEISVEDVLIVQCLESTDHLAKNLPDFPLSEISSSSLMIKDSLVEISPICILHYDT